MVGTWSDEKGKPEKEVNSAGGGAMVQAEEYGNGAPYNPSAPYAGPYPPYGASAPYAPGAPYGDGMGWGAGGQYGGGMPYAPNAPYGGWGAPYAPGTQPGEGAGNDKEKGSGATEMKDAGRPPSVQSQGSGPYSGGPQYPSYRSASPHSGGSPYGAGPPGYGAPPYGAGPPGYGAAPYGAGWQGYGPPPYGAGPPNSGGPPHGAGPPPHGRPPYGAGPPPPGRPPYGAGPPPPGGPPYGAGPPPSGGPPYGTAPPDSGGSTYSAGPRSGSDVMRQKFLDIERDLAVSAGADAVYLEAKRQFDTGDSFMNQKKNQLKQAQETYAYAHQKADGAKNKNLRKFFRPEKYDAKIAKWEGIEADDRKKLSQAEEEARRAEQQRNTLRRQLDGATAERDRRLALLDERKAVLDQVFDGPAGSDRENSLEFERKRLQTERSEEKSAMVLQTQAQESLKQCEQVLLKISQMLQNALGNNTLDLFTGYGGGSSFVSLYAGMQTNSWMQRAQGMTEEARAHFQRAVSINSEIPGQQQLDIEFGGLMSFANILFDNILTDLLVRNSIQDGIRRTERSMAELNRSVAFQDNVVREKKSNVERLDRQIEEKEKVLYDVRAELLRAG